MVLEQLARLSRLLDAAFGVIALELTERRPVDLRTLVSRTVAGQAQERVTLAVAPWPWVLGDEGMLGIAVAALVDNAVEASPPAARPPHVEAQRVDTDRVELRVRDWGVGIERSKRAPRLLRTDKPGHRGVGLPAVERIARLHGGSFRFDAPAEGSLAILSLCSAP
jgi:signal transduction histidine kinase